MNSRLLTRIMIGVALLGCSSSLFAQSETPMTGKLTSAFGSIPGNYAFRVTLDTGLGGCSWAYVNDTDGYYQLYVSMLLSAYLSGKSVTLYIEHDTNSFCHIHEISLNN